MRAVTGCEGQERAGPGSGGAAFSMAGARPLLIAPSGLIPPLWASPSLRLMTTPRRLWLPRTLHAVSAHTAARRRAKLGKAGGVFAVLRTLVPLGPRTSMVRPRPFSSSSSRCILPSRHLKQKTELGGVWTTRALIGCQLFRVSQRNSAPRRLRWPILHSVWVES